MRRDPRWPLLLVGGLLPLTALFSLTLGASGLSPAELFSALREGNPAARGYLILIHLRLPRLLGGLLTGAALAGAGYILQTVLGNPLASPSVIGVNSGAGLLALCAMLFFPRAGAAVPAAAFVGALLSVLLVYGLACLAGASRSTLILSGVALSALLSACMDALISLFPDAAGSRSAFAIGGFQNISLAQLQSVWPFAAGGLALAVLFSRELSILSLGDETAQSLGLRPALFRLIFLLAAALLSASAVSLGGLIGFVGLIAPHMARLLTPGGPRLRFSLSLMCGAQLCVLCDLAARTLFSPYELPVGILLAFLGAPFFLALLWGQRRRSHA